MITSNKYLNNSLTVSLTAMLSMLTSSSADLLKLENNDTLTGIVSTLDANHITLTSPLALAPLEIKAKAIDSIYFVRKTKDNPTHTELLTLSNNDAIPCKILSLNDQQLEISTWYAGKFTIPRASLKSLDFGISQEKIIYSGLDEPDKWSTHQGTWKRTTNGYTCSGLGTLARQLNLTENIHISFNLAWKQSPNFAFRFCADNRSAVTKQSTYELVYNHAGMQLTRYENNTQPAANLASIPLRPHSIRNENINIDLRLNRAKGLLTLHIDGKHQGTWPDPFTKAKGNYIIINNRTRQVNSCSISNLHISSLINGSPTIHSGKRTTNSIDTDILQDTEGEKITGTITSINEEKPNKRTIIFKVKHSTTPLRVPDHRLRTLYFAQEGKPKINAAASVFTATLEGGGTIQLINPKLTDGKITSQHPILGSCTIDIKSVTRIR